MSDDRLNELERDVRVQLHGVTREVAVERTITRDLVESLHRRIDRFEDKVLGELALIKAAVMGNGHG